MTDNQNQNTTDIKEIKNYLEDYLQLQGYYNPNREHKIICRNPEHQETRPSMSLNKKNNTLHCFSCNATYSIIDLAIMDYELGDSKEPLEERLKNPKNIGLAINKIKDLFSINGEIPKKKNYRPEPKPSYNLNELNKGVLGNPTTEYLSKRGITSRELLASLDIKNTYLRTNKGVSGDGVLIIPYQVKEPLETLTYRVIETHRYNSLEELPKEERYKHFGAMRIYDPFKYLNSSAPRIIFITEGEIDTISLYQVLKDLKEQGIQTTRKIGSIALGGINNIKDLLNRIPNIDTTNLYLVLALDNDSRGKQGSRDLETALRELENTRGLNIKFSNALNMQYLQDNSKNISYKDINEALVSNKELLKSFIIDIDKNIIDYVEKEKKGYYERLAQEMEQEKQDYINKNSLLNYLDTFTEHIDNPIKPIQTFFYNFDSIIKGGLREGLITIGAVSSLGKTSFILQLADQIAQSRQQDILYYSLEMAKDELIAKSLSRIMYLKSEYKTQFVKSQSEILNKQLIKPEEKELFRIALDYYKSYAKNFYIKEGVYNLGVEEIRLQAIEHKAKTGKAPLILIDYLQILASPKDKKGLSDKQKTDENILLLKQLSRDLKTPIIVVSSLNRASYSLNVSLESFKESGAIEYTSDLILGLNYSLTEQERQDFNNYARQVKQDNSNLPENEKEKLLNDKLKEIRNKTPRNIKLDILKNRNGEYNKSIEFLFYPQFNYFMEQGASLETHKDLLEHSKEHEKDNTTYIDLPF